MMKKARELKNFFCKMIFTLTPKVAWTNSGVPMLFVTAPTMIIGLLPIIMIKLIF